MMEAALSVGSEGESTDLQAELERVKLQLLSAVDAAQGAQAERAVVEARVRELEHQHHMLKVERDELRHRLAEASGGRRSGLSSGVGRARRLVRKLVHALR